jgi:hypothetical protein
MWTLNHGENDEKNTEKTPREFDRILAMDQ